MINTKYKKIYDKFIENYENIHISPYHEISKEQLNNIYSELIDKMYINDDYSFYYFMNYIIKKLDGSLDAHTKYRSNSLLPINFKMIENEVLVSFPENLKYSNLKSINGVDINTLINEMENIIIYGTPGKRTFEIENVLFNKNVLLSLPSLRNGDYLRYELEKSDGSKIFLKYNKDEYFKNIGMEYNKYLYGNTGTYNFIDNCLIYNHSSVQMMFKDQIENSIVNLQNEDLSNINTIIIDLRGNMGGNSNLNIALINFLKNNLDKKLICLTDYRVFSSGCFALLDLIKLGATTIGDGISTPLNHFGNNINIDLDGYHFGISTKFFPCDYISSYKLTKESFDDIISSDVLKPVIFSPHIYVKQTKEDYVNNIDTVLNYAIEYSKKENLKK